MKNRYSSNQFVSFSIFCLANILNVESFVLKNYINKICIYCKNIFFVFICIFFCLTAHTPTLYVIPPLPDSDDSHMHNTTEDSNSPGNMPILYDTISEYEPDSASVHTSTHVDSSHSQPSSAVFEQLTADEDIESDDGNSEEESEEESDTKQQTKTSDPESSGNADWEPSECSDEEFLRQFRFYKHHKFIKKNKTSESVLVDLCSTTSEDDDIVYTDPNLQNKNIKHHSLR